MTDLLPALIPIISRVRNDITWKKVGPKTRCQRSQPLTKSILKEHLRGIIARGVCPILEGETTVSVACLDLDSHQGETPWEGMVFVVDKIIERLEELSYFPVAFRSTGGSGVHIFIIWDKPQDAYSVRQFLANVIGPLGFSPGTKGVAQGEIEIFPKQDKVEMGDAGSMFILPLSGRSVPLEPLMGFEPGTREDALNIEWKASPPVPEIEREKIVKTVKQQQLDGEYGELYRMLEKLTSDTDYSNWLKTGMAIHAETAGSQEGFDIWDEWSSKGAKYPGRDLLEQKWSSFRNDKDKLVTIGSIKKAAAEKGWQEDYSKDFDDISTAEDILNETPAKGRFTPIRADKYMRRPPPEWTIKGILPRKSTGMTFGGSGDGKTFAILDMACAIALGAPWQGRKTRRGNVVYICAEGAGGFITRLKAYATHHKVTMKKLGDYLTIIPAAPNFLKKVDVEELATEILAINKETELIVIDTLAQTSTGADENSAKDMNIALHFVEVLRARTDSSAHLIHHAGKNEDRGARGSSTLKAALDVQFQVSREGDARTFWVAKMKDGIDNFGWKFALTPVVLGEDDDGDTVSSCVAEYDEKMATARKSTQSKYGPWEKTVLKAWETLGGGNIEVDALLEECRRSTTWDKAKGKDKRRSLANRALQSLTRRGEIVVRDDKIIVDIIV